MSTHDKAIHEGDDIVRFYTDHLKDHGDSAQGVGWKNDQAQEIRFTQLLNVVREKTGFSINDLGCGTGTLFTFLKAKGYSPSKYFGYDILTEMVEAAQDKLKNEPTAELKKIANALEMQLADYCVCSGIFNVKYDVSETDWLKHILATIQAMNEKSTHGFSFNLLTKYSDKEFMAGYLYYADPLFMFDYCKRNYAKNVALLHDYDQYDFTIIVRKQ
jgi:SAM-dependent methyltransferase